MRRALLHSGVTSIAYETVQTVDGDMPLLAPMSEVADRPSVLTAFSGRRLAPRPTDR